MKAEKHLEKITQGWLGDSIGRTGKHSEFCEGHICCPNTGKEECGRVMIFACSSKGEEAVQVVCFGCGEQHRVKEKGERNP